MKLTARSMPHYLRLVESAAQGLRQNDIAAATGLSEATVSRMLRRDEIRAAIEELRAEALAKTGESYLQLLEKALSVLDMALSSPLVERSLKVRVALRLLELGLLTDVPLGVEKAAEPEACPGRLVQ